jgi:hypothetical protein
MPRKPTKKVEEEVIPHVDEISLPVSDKTEFVVLNGDGGEVRTYSVEIHGERAEEFAHQFAAKIGGSVR